MALPSAAEFYDSAAVTYLQQGDVLAEVPLLSPPPSPELVLLRDHETRRPWSHLGPGIVAAVAESDVDDPFSDGSPEHVAVSAERGVAMLITQTCNLSGDEHEHWLVAPVYTVASKRIDLANLFGGKIENLFGLCAHPTGLYDVSYALLSDLRPIRRDSVDILDKIISLSAPYQAKLAEQIARALARDWGYAAGEIIPRTGRYRCLRCNRWYDVENPIRDFTVGESFPPCEKCAEIGKSAQWYLLLRHHRY